MYAKANGSGKFLYFFVTSMWAPGPEQPAASESPEERDGHTQTSSWEKPIVHAKSWIISVLLIWDKKLWQKPN